MTPSQEILESIETRLRHLAQEIAELQSARDALARRDDRSADSREAGISASDEAWIRERAAQLASQSRQAA